MNRKEKAFFMLALAIVSVSAVTNSLTIGNFTIMGDNVAPITVTPPAQSGQLITKTEVLALIGSPTPTPVPTATPTPVPSPTPAPTATPQPSPTASPTPPLGGLALGASATTAKVGSSVTATVSNGPGNSTDWIGLYVASNPDNHQWVNWNYLNGLRTPPAAGLKNASLPFPMPMSPGTYEFRFVPSNGWLSTAKSPTILVTP